MNSDADTNGLEANEIGRFAVGCVSYLVTQSGFVWRELPGFDIGIDGEIEIIKKDTQSRAKIMVQVKGATSPLIRSIRVDRARSHWLYWRAQRNPVLVCEVTITRGAGDQHFNATRMRWIDISRSSSDELRSGSSIPFEIENGFEFPFPLFDGEQPGWFDFIDGVVKHWPTTRIDSVTSQSYLLLHSGKAKEALACVTGIEDSVTEAASPDQKYRLFALEHKARRHGLSPREMRAKLPDLIVKYKQRSVTDTSSIRELGYWHVLAAMDIAAERTIRIGLATEALKCFETLPNTTAAEKLDRADYILYVAMIRYMCENSNYENSIEWKSGRPEHINLERAIECYESENGEALIPGAEPKRTLWRSCLLSRDLENVREMVNHQWAWFGKRDSSGSVTVQDFQDAIMLKAWSDFELHAKDAEYLAGARALLDAAIVSIRGCLPYPELSFWIKWIEENHPEAQSKSR